MHYLTKRINTIKGCFSGMTDREKHILPKDLDEWIARFKKMYVVNSYTIFTEDSHDPNDAQEKLVWVDVEGLDVGWGFSAYEDERGNIDFHALSNVFRNEFEVAIKEFKDGTYANMFMLRDDFYDDTIFIFFIDSRDIEGTDEESHNKMFRLTSDLIHGLRDN